MLSLVRGDGDGERCCREYVDLIPNVSIRLCILVLL